MTCEYHALAYEIECHSRSKQAEQVIHTELGRGHTNQLESANSALIRFRKKNWNIQRLHYHVSTNFGLLESNLTFMHTIEGIEYHWVPELLAVLGLPNIDVVKAYYKAKNREREKRRIERESETFKRKAASAKHAHRVTEQQRRQEYGHKMKELKDHTYETNLGYSKEPLEGECSSETVSRAEGKSKPCVCGSTTHKRTTHKSCPLNKLKPKQSEYMHVLHSVEQDEAVDDSDFEGLYSDNSLLPSSAEEELSSDEEDFDATSAIFCDCGRAHKRDCPLNPPNLKSQNMQLSIGKGKVPLNGKVNLMLSQAVERKDVR